MLLTVTFDPVHDTPEVLAKYAEQWKANPAAWHFLTGSEKDVQRSCRMFGVHAFPNEGLMDHSLHTVLIDRMANCCERRGKQFHGHVSSETSPKGPSAPVSRHLSHEDTKNMKPTSPSATPIGRELLRNRT